MGTYARLAARRFLSDLKRAGRKGAPFTFDAWHANDVCRFVEMLPHVEGEWPSPTLVLEPAQVFVLVNLFGFRRPNGARRFTSALYVVARKNAKSTLAAAILLYCFVVEPELGPQVITAATTGQQARVVFDIATKMINRTTDLREHFALIPYRNAVVCYANGGSFKPINAKASTQDGLNPTVVEVDELHAHKTHDLINVLKSAGGARRSRLFLITTTEGYPNGGPWEEERRFGQQILEGVLEAEHYFVAIFAVDPEDSDFNEDAWHKANPLLAANPLLLDEIRESALEAKGKPGKLAEFRIKKLNRPASTAIGWVDLNLWRKGDRELQLDELEGLECWAGLDLAATTDLCALRLVWKRGDQVVTWGRRWVPEAAVAYRTERRTVPYAAWVESGLIEQTPGEVVDYTLIERAIIQAFDRFRPKLLAYDPWNATQLVQRLQDPENPNLKGIDPIPVVEFRQGVRSFHPAMKEFERLYRAGLLIHGGDPVLRWCAANLVVRKDENDNLAPSKKRSADKIDDVVALIMAIGAISLEPAEPDISGFLASPIKSTR